ncbi:MAG: hypothetical protein HY924_01835 [Elusimicrobia bacterium]|nr:hypothetical protein [Elusimicrobiota bacterium]
MRHSLLAVLLACAALWGAPARAEIKLDGAQWQASQGLPPARRFADVAGLSLPGGSLKARVRARVKVRNAAPAPAEGVLLRYALSARLAAVGADAEAVARAPWVVPFVVEEKRVPRIGPHQTIEASLDPTTLLRLYAARMRKAGYRILELRLQVMVEPHRGVKEEIQTLESRVNVTE